tara:strand:- start:1735 stop:2949 length:1215 start_codon:yes stop_codon:yes gene_type:complete
MNKTINSLLSIGLTKKPQEIIHFTDEPKYPYYHTSPKEDIKEGLPDDLCGQGFSESKNEAIIKSLAECIERISTFKPSHNRGIISKYLTNRNFIDPFKFVHYSDEQLESRPGFLKEVKNQGYKWTEAIDFKTGKKVLLPSQIVYLNEHSELPIREGITTGVALRDSLESASFYATLEVIERDAFMLAYLKKTPLEKITPDTMQLKKLIEYFRRYELYPTIFDITTDIGIPVAMCITLDYSGLSSAVNVGAKAHTNPLLAVKGALLESIQSRRLTRIAYLASKKGEEIKEDEINSLENRYYYWHPVERISDLEFWLNQEEKKSFSEFAKKRITKSEIFKKLINKGYSIYLSDLTWPIIRNKGFSVVRCTIPEMHPLYLSEDFKALYSVHAGTINEDPTLKPHPFI